VKVKNEEERMWYPAVILHSHEDNTYDVMYDDDTTEHKVPESNIKRIDEGMGNKREFNVGELVVFRSDFKPNRIWKIKEFQRGYAVLKTEDKEGLDSDLKVAALTDIERYVPPAQNMSAPLSQPAPLQQQPVVVNVIAGENNSMVSSQPSQEPSQPQELSHVSDESTDFSTPKIRFKKEENENEKEKEKEGGNANFLSGGSIVVKKI
jgi:hypothetical protein